MTIELDKLQLQEWYDSIDAVSREESPKYTAQLLAKLTERVKPEIAAAYYEQLGLVPVTRPYINTIATYQQAIFPGNIDIEKRIANYIRWNASMVVLRANQHSSELGGHIASYASAALLYEVGFNHFWHATSIQHAGDLILFQGHASPGIYARSIIEGRIDAAVADKFRQETQQPGLSSYPHPWLMPDYWQFPTVSMGLGPLMAIYQAKFMYYLHDRQLANTDVRKVWCFVGDGETSEPETLGNIHIAGREKLSNLIYVINCNLQRLDGPVYGNGKIIQELEAFFTGANWKVIKVIWGSNWDDLLTRDTSGKLKQLMLETLDGDYQNIRSRDGKYVREHFFAKYPETAALVADMSDEDIWALTRGGHDIEKIYAAYYEAVHHNDGKPVCILAKTIKGFGMGHEGESQNIAHQQKKLSREALITIKNKLKLPLSTQEVENLSYIYLPNDSHEYQYLQDQRHKLGGYLPARVPLNANIEVAAEVFDTTLATITAREMSTTMAFVRLLNALLKDHVVGKLVIPIVPDESRTFGMEGMFRQFGIWSHVGQNYVAEDSERLMCYKEIVTGQIIQEGINEPGAMSTWIAAATSYANHSIALLPFYIYYSMFGFQRIGDLAWAAGDMRARGFLIGGTAGRTTLSGEGLQHEDGHSHIQAGLIPNCESFDPTFAYELFCIIQHGIQEMYVKNCDKFYYITVMNENYLQPVMPPMVTAADIIAGGYLYDSLCSSTTNPLTVNLLGSGTIFREVIAAANILQHDFGCNVNLFAITSYNKLARNARETTRHNIFQPLSPQTPFISTLLANHQVPVTVSATDYVRAYSEQLREFIAGKYITLGTDGFGRSDYRTNLRAFFEVDRYYIVISALSGLLNVGLLDSCVLTQALATYKIDTAKIAPWLS